MTPLLTGPVLGRLLGDWRSAASGPSYGRLADAVAALVLDGRLPVGARVPAERDLAGHLGVSRATVTAAYDRLRETGFLASRVGAGTWTSLPPGRRRTGASWAPASSSGGFDIDLTGAVPLPPHDAVLRAVDEAREQLPAELSGTGYDGMGLMALRQEIARRYTARGLPTTVEHVIVTSGAQGAIDLVARAVLGPRDDVLVENPTYPAALDLFRLSGARVHGVGVTRDGWDVEVLLAALQQGIPRLLYCIPDFQNPTGGVLPDDARHAVVAAARRTRALVVADESLVDLFLEPVDTTPMAAYDVDDVVISVGAMSKTFWGGLRIGWLRTPPQLQQRLLDVRAAIDIAPPVLEQLVAAALLREADAILPTVREGVRIRRDSMVQALRAYAPEWAFRVPRGGLSLWVELDAPVSSALSAAADAEGVRIVPGSRFGLDGAHERFVRLPYALAPDVLSDAVRRLASIRAALPDSPRRRSAPSLVG